MKIIRVRKSVERFQAIGGLRAENALNLYLYEGMARRAPSCRSFCFLTSGRLFGAVHTRSGVHLHLFVSEAASEEDVGRLRVFIFREFPETESLFGDSPGVERFLRASARGMERKVDFFFMEVERAYFRPLSIRRSVVPNAQMAEKLLELQVSYEVDELGVERDRIDLERTLLALKRRISRGEVTAIYEGPQPVAIAGVNARFEGSCQIGSIYVVPPFRGKGYGSAVTSAHVERMLRRYERVVLFVGEKNHPALRIYEKIGFRTAGRLTYARFTR